MHAATLIGRNYHFVCSLHLSKACQIYLLYIIIQRILYIKNPLINIPSNSVSYMPRSLQSSFHLSTSSLRQGHGAPEGLSPSYCVLCLRDVACNRLCSAYLICAREHRQVLGHARKELLHRDWSSFSGR